MRPDIPVGSDLFDDDRRKAVRASGRNWSSW